MLIPISNSPEGRPEWAIIEWQGDVEHRPEHEPNEDGSMDVGTLSITVRSTGEPAESNHYFQDSPQRR